MPSAKPSKRTLRIPVDQLLIRGNIPAGLNVLWLMALTHRYRSSGWDADPIQIWEIAPSTYRLHDGRHRYFASVIAGRADVLAEVIDPPDE